MTKTHPTPPKIPKRNFTPAASTTLWDGECGTTVMRSIGCPNLSFFFLPVLYLLVDLHMGNEFLCNERSVWGLLHYVLFP